VAKFAPSENGHYLFVQLRLGPETRAETADCRIQTRDGATSFKLPIAPRSETAGKFQGLSPDDVLYLIMPDRFARGGSSGNPPPASPGLADDRSNPRAYHGGNLLGIRDHLDYLRDLGITAIWLTPIVENDKASPQDYHGYGAVDEYAVEQHFGTLQDLQDFVAAAHKKGIKVILDFVPNHVGPRHPWVQSPPKPDWFHGTKDHHLVATGDFQCIADPHAPPGLWRNVVEGWFANVLPDLNQEDPDVAQYFIQNALWWAEETGLDGYRLDTFPYVSRRYWAEWHQALRKVYPRLTTIGEVFNRDPDITSFFAGGRAQFDGIDSGVSTVFDFPFFFALRDVVTSGAAPQRIVDVLAHDRLYPRPALLVPFLGNHDVTRLASAKGMSTDKLKLAFSILLTTRGIPQLYYGDEIGMSGGEDPDNRRDFPGGFPGDTPNAFLQSGRAVEQQQIFSHVQALLRLRREHPALRRGSLEHIYWDGTSYAFARIGEGERLLIAFNAGDTAKSLSLSFADTPLHGVHQLTSLFGSSEQLAKSDAIELSLAAHELLIYAVK